MSIATEITRIQTDRNTIRAKLVSLGLATNTDNLDVLAEAVDGINDNGSISAQVKEGETYTIPKGYHSGSGTVSGVAGGGNYNLQSKAAITPSKQQQQITPDDGYYGLSDVTIGAIPDAYQDVTSVTAAAANVLTGKTIVSSSGVIVAGSMPNNGAVSSTLDATAGKQSYTVPAGYHNGSGTVSITLEEKTVTPSETAQSVTPSAGKVLSKVSVAAIPGKYADVTDADAVAANLLAGKIAYTATTGEDGTTVEAQQIVGTMADNGAVSKTLDATANNQSYTVPAGYHSGEGSVKIVLEEKSATPTKTAQTVAPTAGKVLSKVSIAAIPAAYQDVTGVTATAADVLDGKKIVNASGTVVTGSMTNNGDVSTTIDGLVATSVTIPAGYTTGGTVSLTSDIEEALASI